MVADMAAEDGDGAEHARDTCASIKLLPAGLGIHIYIHVLDNYDKH